jgi:hypothetical protein
VTGNYCLHFGALELHWFKPTGARCDGILGLDASLPAISMLAFDHCGETTRIRHGGPVTLFAPAAVEAAQSDRF